MKERSVHLNLREKNNEDTEIARPRTLSGIDALYFHIEVPYEDYSEFYNKIILTQKLFDSELFTLQGHHQAGTKQYTYCSVTSTKMERNERSESSVSDCKERQLASIGFKNLNRRDNLPSIFVRMNTIALSILGYKDAYNELLDVIIGLGIPILSTHVNRLDLNTYVFGHDFSYLRHKLFSTKMRKSQETVGTDSFYGNDKLQTFYLGSRNSSGIFMRIYNKREEIQAKYNEGGRLKLGIIANKYYEKYGEKLEDISNLWQVEFEVKREELKRYGIDSVEDVWKHADGLHKDIVLNRIRLIEPTLNDIRKKDCPTADVWQLITDSYSVFRDDALPLTPARYKVYKLTPEERLVNHCNDYLDEVLSISNISTSKIEDVKNFIASLAN